MLLIIWRSNKNRKTFFLQVSAGGIRCWNKTIENAQSKIYCISLWSWRATATFPSNIYLVSYCEKRCTENCDKFHHIRYLFAQFWYRLPKRLNNGKCSKIQNWLGNDICFWVFSFGFFFYLPTSFWCLNNYVSFSWCLNNCVSFSFFILNSQRKRYYNGYAVEDISDIPLIVVPWDFT